MLSFALYHSIDSLREGVDPCGFSDSCFLSERPEPRFQ